MRLEAAFYRHVYLGYPLTFDQGQVDQLEDRYLGMVEASGSNPDLSILVSSMMAMISGFPIAKGILWTCQRRASWFMR
jgi:hypothetical protein